MRYRVLIQIHKHERRTSQKKQNAAINTHRLRLYPSRARTHSKTKTKIQKYENTINTLCVHVPVASDVSESMDLGFLVLLASSVGGALLPEKIGATSTPAGFFVLIYFILFYFIFY